MAASFPCKAPAAVIFSLLLLMMAFGWVCVVGNEKGRGSYHMDICSPSDTSNQKH